MAVLIGGLATLPAHAGNWVLIGHEGDRPARNHYYADIDDIADRTPPEAVMAVTSKTKASEIAQAIEDVRIKRVTVVQVLEPADGPDTVSYQLLFKCKDRLVSIPQAIAWSRDATQKTLSKPTWMSVPRNWIGQAYMIGCEPDKWRPAVEAAAKQKQQGPLADIGLVYVGDYVLNTELSDVTWETFWKDGARPEYTTKLTREELEKKRQQTLTMLADAGKQVAQKAAKVRQDIENADKEDAFITRINKTFKSKPAAQQQILFGMEGWTEKEVVDFWGVPLSVRELSGTRQLDYYSQDDTRQNVALINGHGQVVSAGQTGELRECELSLIMREGGGKPGYRLVDYRIKGQNCHRSTLRRIVE